MPTRPVLFLVIDGIPYDLAEALWAAGEFGALRRPRPVVSVFPSLTHVAVPALLGPLQVARPPGYEARWFHPPSGEVRGGLRDEMDAPSLAPFDERPTTLAGNLAVYTVPRALSYGVVRWVTRRFLEEGGAWLGYLAATDGLAHFAGRDALGAALADITGALTTLRVTYERVHGVRPALVICSDHGFEFGSFQHVGVADLARMLAVEGLRIGPPGAGEVVLAPHGEKER